MSQLRRLIITAAVGALICGVTVALLMGVGAIGTSVVLPGLGIVVAGPLAAAALGALIGAAIGFVLGLLVGIVIILISLIRRRKTSPL